MNKSSLKNIATTLNIIQNGRFATLLFIIGSFLILIKYNGDEKSLLQTMYNISSNEHSSDSKVKSAKIGELASLIFLFAVSIYANNAINTLEMELNNLNSDLEVTSSDISSTNGLKLIAFFNLIKVIGFAGAALGYHMNSIAAQSN